MTVIAWRIGADTPKYAADDMTGIGAKITGGRWNRPGGAVMYAAPSIALACLETIVNLGVTALPLNRYVVQIDIPDDVFAAATVTATPPVGWDAIPVGLVSLDLGDAWLRAGNSALLLVPSVIVHEELNILINPEHPDAQRITAVKKRKFIYDPRVRVSS